MLSLGQFGFDLGMLAPFDKIFVLVSGGIDSTLLWHVLHREFPTKTFPVNCYNPYEVNVSLDQIKTEAGSMFIQIKPAEQYNYGQILKESFQQLNKAAELRKAGGYHKKVFSCCYYIKHKAFLNDPLFQQPNTVVISGIKAGDGQQRRIWLTQMRRDGKWFHRHESGQLYCYPFRDVRKREFDSKTMNILRTLYPNVQHSGCAICPVLVLFGITEEKDRYIKSVQYARRVVNCSALLCSYCPDLYGGDLDRWIKKG